jgi:hypothetical protein
MSNLLVQITLPGPPRAEPTRSAHRIPAHECDHPPDCPCRERTFTTHHGSYVPWFKKNFACLTKAEHEEWSELTGYRMRHALLNVRYDTPIRVWTKPYREAIKVFGPINGLYRGRDGHYFRVTAGKNHGGITPLLMIDMVHVVKFSINLGGWEDRV